MDSAPVSSIEMFRAIPEETPVGSIAIPMRDHMSAPTVISLLQTQWPGPVVKLLMQGSVLTLNRNACIQQMQGDWILFIDDDMVWQPNAVMRLLEQLDSLRESVDRVDILAGLFCRRTDPFQPVLYMREGPQAGAYNILEDWHSGDVVEVDATGMAFTLITRQGLELLTEGPMPSYEERVASKNHPDFFRWHGSLGEDLRFCQDVKALGGRIFVDTSIEIGHVGERVYSVRDFWGAVAFRDQETEDQRREANDKMGLPTLSAAEARGRLGW